jgi:amino acid adenylation domain-containing protein
MVTGLADLPVASTSPPRRRSPTVFHHQRVLEWNDTATIWPRGGSAGEGASLQLLFEAQAARTPAAPALAAPWPAAPRGPERLTYAELDARANRLARALRRLGVGPEAVVAVAMERSVEMIVALLGILKAGGAWLPLDPTYPRERLAFLLADSGAKLALAQERWRARLPAGPVEVFALDGGEGGLGQDGAGEGANPPRATGPAGAAYVIYTSGSTGWPKGVLNSHAAIVNRLRWGQQTFPLGTGDRVLQKTPFTFDVSVWEMFAPLVAGAELVMARPEGHRDNAYLVEVIRDRRITTIHFVPSMLGAFLDGLDGPALDSCRSLRRVMASGEALTADLVARFHARFGAPRPGGAPAVELRNLYGPTEAAVEVSSWRCSPADAGRGVPIGRPIANLRLHVHDGELRLAAAGAAGELLIGGAGLARGYLGRPELTAERFVPDPWSEEPGGRLYRTGDLARHRQDGAIEYLGRLDHQVKVRGFRIELGEIEAAMRRFPGVAEVVVAARDDGPGGAARLVAYYVPAAPPEVPAAPGAAPGPPAGPAAGAPLPAVEDWKRFLDERLPEHMIPSAFVALDALPLGAHGKIDRRGLPAPGRERPALAQEFVAPRGAAEQAIAALWSELLGLDRVGALDSFFDLGGHSLLVAQAQARLRERTGAEVSLVELFRRPRAAELAPLVERARQGEAPGDLPEPPPLVRAPRDGRPLPLSFAQERVWLLDQLEPGGNLAYNFQLATWLRGPLRPGLLRRALGEIVRRHEVLRTTFPAAGGAPIQVIHAPWPVPLPLVDLGGLPAARRRACAEGLIAALVTRSFDVARLPLIRWRLLRLHAGRHALVQVEHHLVHDGWSLAVMLREIATLYEAFARGASSPLPELAAQYSDYAVWQRAWLQGEALERQLAFFERRLAGSPPVTEVAADHPRPPGGSFRGDVHVQSLAPELYQALRRFRRGEGFTLYMTMLAGFLALLHRATGDADLVIGTSNANRRTRELEAMIGMMVNSLPLRADLSGRPAFGALLGRVREAALELFARQDLPFERLVERLRVPRRPGRNPIFQVMFNFHDAPVPDARFADLEMSPELRANRTAKLDLNLIVVPRAEQRAGRAASGEDSSVTVRWEYNRDLFDGASIQRLAAHLEVLLAAAIADPGLALPELPLLGPGERAAVLHGWNDTRAAFPSAASIPELFAGRAELAPDAIAVVCGDRALSYGELALRAGRAGRRLRGLGIGRGDLVAIAGERSLAMVEQVLGVLAAGAAYLPLDPGQPAERLEWMLRASGARRLPGEELLPGPPAGAGPPAAAAPTDGETGAGDDPAASQLVHARAGEGRAALRQSPAGAGDLAYVMYTSGSTGRPKGVAVTHANVVRLVRGSGCARFGPEEVFLQLAPLSFDASTFELWGPLLNGGRLVVFPPESPTLGALGEAIRRHAVTTLWLTAGLFHEMVDGNLDALRPLRQLLAGGDVLSPEHVARLLAALPGLALINGYGPTEGTTFSCCHGLRPAPARRQLEAVPIGRPIGNARAFVVDPELRPQPIGFPGELLIGGDGLAVGYHRQPELTAERFLPDPFGGPGERLYRTGDRVRWRADGTLEFLGRIDRQVKIRGFRVEPEEVEAALLRLPRVEAACVVVARWPPAEARLVAYVVPAAAGGGAPRAAGNGTAGGPEPAAGPPRVEGSAGALARELRRRLPEYMVPAAFVELAALPLTPNGKVDRAALPAPPSPGAGGGEAAGTVPFAAPRNPAEEILAGLWAEVLGVERVGIWDDFFALGGHSLLATRLGARIAAAFGVEVSLRAFFEAPTVAALAARVGALAGRAGGRQRAAAPPLRPVRRDRPLPLSFAQQRLWFLQQVAPASSTYNISRLYRLGAGLLPAALAAALARLVERHEVLRTRYLRVAGAPVQSVDAPSAVPLPEVELAALPEAAGEDEARRVAAGLFRRAFDLGAGGPVRVALVRLRPDERLLLLSLHHVATDGWSMEVLERELGALYTALAAGREPALPPLPIQYGDFAAWQRGWLKRPVLRPQLEYWRARLAGAPDLLELPSDRPRPPVQSFRGALATRPLPPADAAALAALAGRQGVTLFMALLAACDLLLYRYTGQTDLLVGTPIANRNRAEIEGLIGFFVNTLVLRADLAEDVEAAAFLARLRELALDAYAHQDLPFERLVEELRPERHLGHSPLFQVMLALEEAPPTLPAPLLPAPFAVDNPTTKFDLTLTLVKSGTALTLRAEYSTDLFDASTAERLLGHAANLLAALAAAPAGARLSQLPLLLPEERRELLAAGTGAATPYPRRRTVHELFAEQAARRPDAVALVMGGECLTRGELDRRAGRLARRLRELGVGPEEPVGVYLERSPALVVALLGALASGAAYLPLDAAYPRERVALLLARTGSRVVITREGLRGDLPAPPPAAGAGGTYVLCLDAEANGLEGGSESGPTDGLAEGRAEPRRFAGDADSLAYVMFTSGSTGEPKGVAVPHRAVARLVRDTDYASFGPRECFLQLAPAAFDASTFEIWGALLNGGRLAIFRPGPVAPAELEQTLREEGVTTLWLTAGLFHLVVDAAPGALGGVRQLLAGGDVLSPPHVRRALAGLAPGGVLVNGYGPTESTTFACCHRMLRPEDAGAPVAIGRPIANTSIQVAGRDGEPVPPGVPGELRIGGDGLARGYLGRPDLTAERFVPDPFAVAPGARLYRTGDLVRRGRDGVLHFLGRIDDQVKIRGFRVELGEIEAALRRLPGVAQAAAVARDGGPAAAAAAPAAAAASAERRVAAYVVRDPGARCTAAELRQDLARGLPDYMIPAEIVFLESLPLTPHGKVDRRALPAPGGAQSAAGGAAQPPRSELERLIATLWQDLLQRTGFGIEDDFFELGGHSLLIAQVQGRLQEALGRDVPVVDLFRFPTIRSLAARLEEAADAGRP